MRAKAKVSILVECYDDYNEKVPEESREATYVFDSWQQAQATYQLAKSQIQDRQTRERDKLETKPTLRVNPTTR